MASISVTYSIDPPRPHSNPTLPESQTLKIPLQTSPSSSASASPTPAEHIKNLRSTLEVTRGKINEVLTLWKEAIGDEENRLEKERLKALEEERRRRGRGRGGDRVERVGMENGVADGDGEDGEEEEDEDEDA